MVKYENNWTKLGLGKLRGNAIFKGIWRTVRIGLTYGLLGIAQNGIPAMVAALATMQIPGMELLSGVVNMIAGAISPEMLTGVAIAVEKILRTTWPDVDF